MRSGKRFGLSAFEKSDIWSRLKAGQLLHEIGRAFDKPHTSIRCLLLPRGGIPPAARRAAHDMQRSADSHGGKSSMPSRSAKGLWKWKMERFLVIGKAIC
jgi:hypothetical protein